MLWQCELLALVALMLLAYLAWRWHAKAVALVAGLLPVYLLRCTVFGIPTNVLEASIAVVTLIGLVQPTVRKQWHVAWRTLPRPVLVSTALFVLAACLSTAISPELRTSLGILKGWIIAPLAYAFMVYASGENPKSKAQNPNKIKNTLIASGVVMALVGISQLGTLERIRGVYDVPNSLALFLAPLIVLAVAQAQWVPAGIMFLALLATQSLAGIGAVVITLAVAYIIFLWPRPYSIFHIPYSKLFAVAGIVLVVTVVVSIPKIRYLLQPHSSAAVRLQLWSVSTELIRQHPLLGIGLGTFEPAYQEKLHERFLQPTTYNLLPEFIFRDPHNWILSFWLNVGLLGLSSFIGLHLYIFSKGRVATYALLTLLLFGLVDTIYWKNDLATLHWVLLALVLR